MINFVKGRLELVRIDSCVVDFGGFGLEVIAPKRVLNGLVKKVGEEIKLWTILKIKEEEMMLYGFLNSEEIDFFRKLVSVSGVGPKSAMSIMDLGEWSEVVAAIDNADVDYVTKASGVGKKTAQRLIVELKGKLVVEDGVTMDAEVLDAMKALGYTKVEYEDLTKMIPEDVDKSEEKIAWLLKRLGR